MIIENTGIADTNLYSNNEATKILLMNQVVDHFLPLFREEIERKKKVLNEYQTDYKKLSTDISRSQTTLLKMRDALRRELVIQDIIEESNFLFSKEILYGKNKKMVLDILGSLEKSDLTLLNSRLKLLRNLTQKNVQKVNIN